MSLKRGIKNRTILASDRVWVLRARQDPSTQEYIEYPLWGDSTTEHPDSRYDKTLMPQIDQVVRT